MRTQHCSYAAPPRHDAASRPHSPNRSRLRPGSSHHSNRESSVLGRWLPGIFVPGALGCTPARGVPRVVGLATTEERLKTSSTGLQGHSARLHLSVAGFNRGPCSPAAGVTSPRPMSILLQVRFPKQVESLRCPGVTRRGCRDSPKGLPATLDRWPYLMMTARAVSDRPARASRSR